MNIACLGDALLEDFSQHTLNFFSTLEAVIASKEKWDAIILLNNAMNKNDTLLNLTTLKILRRHEDLCLLPIFAAAKTELAELCDGNYENESLTIEKITHITKRLNKLKVMPLDAKSRFLAYGYSRAPWNIYPNTDLHSFTYYHYPVADLFIKDNAHILSWLNALAEKNMLTKGDLFHAQFICMNCESGHLSFTERCPNCHHENIQQNPFLHCFTCGLIAPESEFIQEGRFKCPKCSSALRHIGDDYDRPLESGQCFHCNEYYQEAELWVRCMLCEKDYSPDRLGKSYSRLYSISESNAANILNTYFMQHFNVFDDIHYLELPFFMTMLDWLFVLNQRYSEEVFSLIGLTIKLSPEAIPFVPHFAEQLKRILRDTDMLTRILDEEIWLLLPKTNEEGMNVVISRIHEAKSSFAEKIHWKIASICSTHISKEITMEKVMLELRTKWL